MKAEKRTLGTRDAWLDLRARWKEANPKGTNKELAQLLGVRPQSTSVWTSGSDPEHHATVRALIQLAVLFNVKLVIREDATIGVE